MEDILIRNNNGDLPLPKFLPHSLSSKLCTFLGLDLPLDIPAHFCGEALSRRVVSALLHDAIEQLVEAPSYILCADLRVQVAARLHIVAAPAVWLTDQLHFVYFHRGVRSDTPTSLTNYF